MGRLRSRRRWPTKRRHTRTGTRNRAALLRCTRRRPSARGRLTILIRRPYVGPPDVRRPPLGSSALPLTSYLLPATSYLLPLASCLLPLTSYLLPRTSSAALSSAAGGRAAPNSKSVAVRADRAQAWAEPSRAELRVLSMARRDFMQIYATLQLNLAPVAEPQSNHLAHLDAK